MVNMPVVAATGFEGYIHHTATYISQIALTYEILAVRVRLTLGPLGAQRVAIVAEPSAELVNQLLAVTHVHRTLLVGGKLRSHTIQTAQCRHGNYLTVGSSELVAGKDVAEEMRLQVVIILWTEVIVERTARELCLVLFAQFVSLLGVVPLSRALPWLALLPVWLLVLQSFA